MDTLSKEETLKQEIIHFGKLIYEKGYSVSIDGNISCRISESEILITVTGARLGFLTLEDFAVIDYNANLLRGKKFTSEYDLHLNIYKAREDVNAIIHAHAPHCIALSCLDVDILNHLYITVASIPITEFGLPSSKESFEKLKPCLLYT
ncbi:MAG: class II aldolase/adducin family protein, partial [Leptospiraceae bacterium]|nr:class II aldolase/adducin family protein [Leptospiraceae bacterium]